MRGIVLALMVATTAPPVAASDRQERRLEVLSERLDRLQLAHVMEDEVLAPTAAIRSWATAESRVRAGDGAPRRWHRLVRRWPVAECALSRRERLWEAWWDRYSEWAAAASPFG